MVFILNFPCRIFIRVRVDCYWWGLRLPYYNEHCARRIRFAKTAFASPPQYTSLRCFFRLLTKRSPPTSSCIISWCHSLKCRQVQKGAPMIAARQVWGIIHGHVPRKQWVSSEDIYAIVELHGKLDEEDRQPQSSRSRTPKWKTLVHNVLANRVKKGRIRSRKRQNHT